MKTFYTVERSAIGADNPREDLEVASNDESIDGAPKHSSGITLVGGGIPKRLCSRMAAFLLQVMAVGAIGFGVYFFVKKQGVSFSSSAPSTSEEFQGTVAASELATHSTSTDCWMALHGRVYDLTSYAPFHPGGPDYVWDYCGTDATVPYGREHSSGLLSTVSNTLLGPFEEDDFQQTEGISENDETGCVQANGSSEFAWNRVEHHEGRIP